MASTTEKTEKSKAAKKKVNFEYFAPGAKKVEIAGTFNDWKPAPLKKSNEGKWSGSLDLQLGKYEYRYLVDETWQNDQRPVECVPNNFGSWNCVVEVKG